MSRSGFNRRQFMAAASLTAAQSQRILDANERIGVAVIGCGGRGLLGECLQFGPEMNVEVAAVCDTWRQQRERRPRRSSKPQGRSLGSLSTTRTC